MNPLTNVKNTQKLNETELELGLVGSKSSWHEGFKDSAWIFIGGLPYDLTEGDIVCVFSQYGEIVHINLVRDKQSGKSKGFCFLCFEDQRSTILAVDNLNSIKLLGRTLRVNHVADYKMPKEHEEDDEVTRTLREEGCAPQVPGDDVQKEEEEQEIEYQSPSSKKSKKEKKKDKKKKKKRSNEAETTSEHGTTPEVTDSRSNREAPGKVKEQRYRDVRGAVKEERHDPGYDKYTRRGRSDGSSDVDVSRSIRNKEMVKSEPGHGMKERGHDEYNPKTYRQQDRIKEMSDDVKLSRTIECGADERRPSGSRTSRDSSCDDAKYEYRHGRDDDDDRRENRTKSNHERRSNSSHDRHSDRYRESEPGRAGSDVMRKGNRDGEYSSRYDDHDSSRRRTTLHDHSTHSRRDRYEKDRMTNSPRRERHRSRSPRARYERMKITVEIEK